MRKKDGVQDVAARYRAVAAVPRRVKRHLLARRKTQFSRASTSAGILTRLAAEKRGITIAKRHR